MGRPLVQVRRATEKRGEPTSLSLYFSFSAPQVDFLDHRSGGRPSLFRGPLL